jgi:hypothetical protein
VKQGVKYRGYYVYHDGTEYVAESTSGDGECFEVSSNSCDTLYRAIDELWCHLDSAADLDQSIPVPAWYQAWLDAGADGRIRLLGRGKFESIAPSRSWWGLNKLLAGALICAAAVMAVPRLDINKDGSIDMDDAATMIEKVYLTFPPKSSIHKIRWGQRIYDVNLHPSPEQEVDFDADDVRINGISLKRGSTSEPPTSAPDATFTPPIVVER